jgi:hypothetical protein
MKRQVTVFIFFIIATLATAQIPGYRGCRLTIAYNADLSPAILSPGVNTKFENNNWSHDAVEAINFSHGLELDYVIKRRTSLCLGVQFVKTGLSYSNDYHVNDYNYPYNYYGTVYYSANQPVILKSTNVSVGFKFFKRNYIAPFGKYRKLDLVIYLDKVLFDETAFTLDQKNKFLINENNYSFKTFGIGYTVGKQRIYFNRLIVDTGIRFGIIPAGIFRVLEIGDISDILELTSSSSYNPNDLERQMKQQANLRLLGSQLVNFHIGIGFLAY